MVFNHSLHFLDQVLPLHLLLLCLLDPRDEVQDLVVHEGVDGLVLQCLVSQPRVLLFTIKLSLKFIVQSLLILV